MNFELLLDSGNTRQIGGVLRVVGTNTHSTGEVPKGIEAISIGNAGRGTDCASTDEVDDTDSL